MSKSYGNLLVSYEMRIGMDDAGACCDNAVVERFFGSWSWRLLSLLS